MIYKHFRIQILIRLVAVLGLGYAAIYILSQTSFWLLAVWIVLIDIVLILNLIYYIEKSYRELSQFLLAIEQNDYSNTYSENHPKDPFKPIYQKIMGTFHHLRNEREFNHFYLKEVVDHIGTSILGFDEEGEIQLLNRSARSLLNKPYLRNVDSLRRVNEELMNAIQGLKPGQQKVLKTSSQGKIQSLLVRTTDFKLMDRSQKIVSFQDISRELELQETESWQKLIRVLTHEITNSVIPIATLSSLSNQIISHEDGSPRDLSELNDDDIDDLRGSLRTIEKRSQGLAGFVEEYKSLTHIPALNINEFAVKELIEEVRHLLKPQFNETGIIWKESYENDHITLRADRARIEQVMINLILNALEALENHSHGEIEVNVGYDEMKRVVIEIKDNGPGIPPELAEKIFIPFFSTKDRGSGIGLSYSRQIMSMHQGSLSMVTDSEQGAIFSMVF